MPWKDEKRFRAYQKAYYADPVNRERKREWSKAYREKKREEHKAQQKERYARDRDRIRAYHAARYKSNKDKHLALTRAWKQANAHKVREYSMRRVALKRQSATEPVDYAAIWRQSDGSCGICGEQIMVYDQIHFDHIVPLSKGGEHAAGNIQVSHAQCNMKKGARVA